METYIAQILEIFFDKTLTKQEKNESLMNYPPELVEFLYQCYRKEVFKRKLQRRLRSS